MKKGVFVVSIVCVFLLCVALVFILGPWAIPTRSNAEARVHDFVELVNYHADEPGKIYDYLTEEYRAKISKADFEVAFFKERSYPYLTPFFINFVSIEMNDGNKSGVAYFLQAARLPGMEYEMTFVYENGNYYMIMEEYSGFVDGSYLDKFEKIPNYLIYGWE